MLSNISEKSKKGKRIDRTKMPTDPRNPQEKIIDNLLLLYIICQANLRGRMEGITKLQKLVFLAESKLNEMKIKGINYTFFKSHFGTFDWYLSNDVNRLVEDNLFTEGRGIKLTKEGKEILKDSGELLKENVVILEIIDSVIKKYAKYKLPQIIEVVYNIKVFCEGKMMKIKDIPEQKLLLKKLRKTEAKRNFKIGEGWIETLDLYFDRESFKSLKEAMEEVKTKGTALVIKNAPSI